MLRADVLVPGRAASSRASCKTFLTQSVKLYPFMLRDSTWELERRERGEAAEDAGGEEQLQAVRPWPCSAK